MSDGSNALHGFKRITAENLLEPDYGSGFFSRGAEGCVEAFSSVTIDEHVPPSIAAQLEVVRGAMIYGWLYYPLLTLGSDQCHRILESGARLRCQQLGIKVVRISKEGEERPRSFTALQNALIKAGAIAEGDREMWDIGRKLRNWASHPDNQSILMPGHALTILKRTVELLGKLFRPST
jgi:hypothetical protein